MDEKKFEIIQKKKLKRLEQKTEEDIDMEIDFKVKRQLKDFNLIKLQKI